MAETAVGTPSGRTSKDEWRGVTDARMRKRIQDKLAQRARRKRLRDAKSTTVDNPVNGQSQDDEEAFYQCFTLEHFDSCLPSTDTSVLSLSPPRHPSTSPPSAISAAGMVFELAYPLNVFSAIFINGQVLGMSTDCKTPADRSPLASPDVPLALQPTAIQLATVHFRGVDRFPFPKMRDNVITMTAFFDEDELARDLHMMPSFTIKLGGAPWDPSAWKIEKPFADKWGFLFY